MKILVFTEGTIIMHPSEKKLTRKQIVKQSKMKIKLVYDYAHYIPIGDAAKKLQVWKKHDVEIFYLTSRRIPKQINDIRNVLKKYNFPGGQLLFRKKGEEYKDIAERIVPDILIEDDCESIGGEAEMTYTYIKSELKTKIKPITVKEFGGIDYLPDDPSKLFEVDL